MKEFQNIFQFKITLKDTKPSVWRRIQVPETYTFWDLHVAIQDAMGWYDCHLHEFEMWNRWKITKVSMGIPDDNTGWRDVKPGWKIKMSEYFSLENKSAEYTYDFGDTWRHAIILEKILPRESNKKYPICIDGKRACPPEDCGGPWGYAELLDILADPKHRRHKELKEWIGGPFDSEHFDPTAIGFDDPAERLKTLQDFS